MASKKTTQTKAAAKPSKTPSKKATSHPKRSARPLPVPAHALATTTESIPATAVPKAAPVAATSAAQPGNLPPESAPPQTVSAVLPTESKKLSAIDAAAKILAETGQALNCPELIALMAAKGYWTSPGGKTPASTLYASFLRELKTKGAQARFQKTERGKFAFKNPA